MVTVQDFKRSRIPMNPVILEKSEKRGLKLIKFNLKKKSSSSYLKRFTEYYTHTRYNLQWRFIWMPNNITLINWFEIIPHCSHCYIYNCPSLLPLSATYTSGLLWWMKINRLFLKNQQKHNFTLLHAKSYKNLQSNL